MKIKALLAAASFVALVAGNASAADLIINEQSAPPVSYDDVYDWTGPYVGVNAGIAFGLPTADPTDECDWYWCDSLTFDPSADPTDHNFFPFVGVQVGFNYQLDNNLVVGIEADVQSGDLSGNNDETPALKEALVFPSTFAPDIDLWGTLRGRVGVTMDRTLIYATGGLAWGHTNFDNAWWLPDDFDTEDTRFGYAVGVGVEQSFADNISGKLEYLFVNLGQPSDTMPFTTGNGSDLAFQTVRAGLNFHF